MKKIFPVMIGAIIYLFSSAAAPAGLVITKHILPAPAPADQPQGFVTPDGTFNIRAQNAPFHSDLLADAMGLDQNGKDPQGHYLNLNHAIYTSYRLASDPGQPTAVLVLMPGTWVGAMSIDQFARDTLRMAEKNGEMGLEVWIVDRRSEQLEDHTGMRWAVQNQGKLPAPEIISGLSDYYRPAFTTEGPGKIIDGKKFTALNQDALRFMANWGADTTIRDWREVVLAAHRAVGNEVVAVDGQMVIKKRGTQRVFIGGHSLGGSLTVLYASYDFDRRPDHELLGMNDVDGLVLLEGGSFPKKEITVTDAESYRQSLADKFDDGMVYFDLNMFGIQYSPATMISLGISGFAADNARGLEATFPQYARPKIIQLPRITNEAALAFAMDNDFSAFFIARLSLGEPTGELGRQFRSRAGLPFDPNKCGLLTPWAFGHKPMAPDFLYGWIPISGSGGTNNSRCAQYGPEVTDIYAFAHAAYGGADSYVEAPELSTGPNDYSEWYFPPRLSTDSGRLGSKVVEQDGTELFNGTHVKEISLPVITFFGGASMGYYTVPKLDKKNFPEGVLKQKQTQVHLIERYTHMDITQATRNNQPDLTGDERNFNAPAVYTYRFVASIVGW